MSYMEKIYEENIPDEYRWERIRLYRNDLLKKTDHKMVNDAPWDLEVWKKYRQELRDITKSVSDPAKIVFPIMPEDNS